MRILLVKPQAHLKTVLGLQRFPCLATLEFGGDLLRLGVAGHDGFRRFVGALRIAAEDLCGGGDAGADVRHRHRDANAARGTDEHLFRRHVQQLCGEGRHLFRVGQTLAPGAGVRVAGVDHDGLGLPAFHAFGADLHGCGADLIGREHAGGGGGHFGHDEREVALGSLVRALAGAEAFDVAKHAAGQETFGCDDGTFDRFQILAHVRLLGTVNGCFCQSTC